MEVVEFAGYTEREKAEIAKTYLIPRQLEESGLADKGMTFTDDAVMEIVSRYTRESGVRQLERQVGAVARKLARRIATGEAVDHDDHPRRRPRAARPAQGPPGARRARPTRSGVATGMYYTPAGGDIMFVEAAIRRLYGVAPADSTIQVGGWGNVSLILTGQLGDVMKESARAALTYAATHASTLADPAGPARLDRGPRPRPRRGDPQGRPLGRRGDGHGDRLGHVGPPGPQGRRHDRRDHPPRPGPADRRRQGEGARRGTVPGSPRSSCPPRTTRPTSKTSPSEVRDALKFHCVSTLDEVFAIALLPAEKPVDTPKTEMEEAEEHAGSVGPRDGR